MDPITEERASRCMARLDLLSTIREKILWYPDLDTRLRLCQRGHDMPEWWIPGEHDKELLIGELNRAKHQQSKLHVYHNIINGCVLQARLDTAWRAPTTTSCTTRN